ncbi:MAG: hypothetical protein ACWA49_12390 [Ruegeria sp.]
MDHALKPSFWTVVPQIRTVTRPERKPGRAPVFIHDAVTPWGRETLLLKLLREQAADQEE